MTHKISLLSHTHFIQSCVLKTDHVLNSVLNVRMHPKYIYDIVNFMIIKRNLQMSSPIKSKKFINFLLFIAKKKINNLIFIFSYRSII